MNVDPLDSSSEQPMVPPEGLSKALLQTIDPPEYTRHPSYVGDPTTAVDLHNVSNVSALDILPVKSASLMSEEVNSLAGSGPYDAEYANDGHSENNDQQEEEEDLHNILKDLIRQEPHSVYTTVSQSLSMSGQHHSPIQGNSSVTDYKIFPVDDNVTPQTIIENYISLTKEDDSEAFHDKFKHVFILSSAGKPIYSMNGSDDVILGYMGLITTVVSTFKEVSHEEIKSITYNDVKIVVMNKDPLIFVTITKLGYEKMESRTNESILSHQLTTLYNYLLSAISKHTITKSFHNRMNYDLRKLLTPLDFQNLDSLCMKLTYGLTIGIDRQIVSRGDLDSGFGVFLGQLLDSAIECARVTNTTRQKLNSILLSTKKLKTKPANTSNSSSQPISILKDSIPFLNGTASPPHESYVAEDLLFALLLNSTDKILSAMKPKHHNLKNEDLKILLAMVSNQRQHSIQSNDTTEDLWVPICMPYFNSGGFLYAFIKTIKLDSTTPVTIVLLSGNKNSFFQMKEVSEHLVRKLTKNPIFVEDFCRELSKSRISLTHDLQETVIKHFIYKSKSCNQFVSSGLDQEDQTNSILKLVHFYSTLHNTQINAMKLTPTKSIPPMGPKNQNKRFTYMKSMGQGPHSMIGFMLFGDTYEFYCLCDVSSVSTRELINRSLKIIKWCEKYSKRLFIETGAVF
ncbi:vacuolar fusion protein Mon1p [[Candida] anglica]|uniref:Vacuolar fusion protein MON1 n=1 Tax=[Candida] anglica TaxID=148631 RepID=A0ABP0ELJ5_9ASCO